MPILALTVIEITALVLLALVILGVVLVRILPNMGALFGSPQAPPPASGAQGLVVGDWDSTPSVIGRTHGYFTYRVTADGQLAVGADVRFTVSDTSKVLIMTRLGNQSNSGLATSGDVTTDSSGIATLELAANSRGMVTVSVTIKLWTVDLADPDVKAVEVDPHGSTQ
jgi:hypothetical protein